MATAKKSRQRNPPLIGILGGIGPESSAYFYLDLILELQKSFPLHSNTDYPHIIVNSIPAGDLIFQNKNRNRLQDYSTGLRTLESLDVSFVVIVCNTAHVYFRLLQRSVSVQIIDLKKEVRNYFAYKNISQVTLLCSATSTTQKLYQFDGITYTKLLQSDLIRLSKCIHSFNLGKQRLQQIRVTNEIYQKYQDKGFVVLGCSEVALMLKKNLTQNSLDPMRLLIRALVRECQKTVLIKKKSKVHGDGIFATKQIPKKCRFYHLSIASWDTRPRRRYARINSSRFINDEIANHINHSCSPNSAFNIQNDLPFLYATRNIEANEEILCDYSKTEIGGTRAHCLCGSPNCKGYFLRVE